MEVEMREPDMSLEDAGMLLSAMGNLQFRQVVDPKRTVRMEMKKTVLKKLFKYLSLIHISEPTRPY